MNEVAMSPLARRRAQQAAITPELIDAVLNYADLEFRVSKRQVALRLSAEALLALQQEHGRSVADRAASVVLILVDEAVVLAMRAIGPPSRRHQRRRLAATGGVG